MRRLLPDWWDGLRAGWEGRPLSRWQRLAGRVVPSVPDGWRVGADMRSLLPYSDITQ